MPRREMLARMGADELEEWWAFFQLQPFGEAQHDYRMARLCVEMHRTGMQGIENPELEHFLPRYKPGPQVELTGEEQEAMWRAYVGAMTKPD